MSSSSSELEPLYLTIRFASSVPDLLLTISSPQTTTGIALKHLIRTHLQPPISTQRYRLISSGKPLADTSVLSNIFKLPPPPPDPSGKGKAPERIERVYIHCVIGDVLSPAELEAETLAAETIVAQASKPKDKNEVQIGASEGRTTTTPAPRGFDRLLTTGFTAPEVNQLRLQFRSIQSNIHTPDTMPSPSTLLRMEDAWIDDNTANTGAGATIADGGGFDFGDDIGGALDDLLWGNIMGFLWPLGCLGWVSREEGVWSRRRKVAVFTGAILSFTFGILRVLA